MACREEDRKRQAAKQQERTRRAEARKAEEGRLAAYAPQECCVCSSSTIIRPSNRLLVSESAALLSMELSSCLQGVVQQRQCPTMLQSYLCQLTLTCLPNFMDFASLLATSGHP